MTVVEAKLIIKELDRQEKITANTHSITVARLAHIVLSGLGGEKAANSVKLEQLLPFKPSEIYGPEKTAATPGTIKLIKKLILNGSLPIVFAKVFKDEMTFENE